jgi:hypothetical protein
MKKEDFYKLHVGQIIWWRGKRKKIRGINKATRWPLNIMFEENYNGLNWELIMEDCSLEEDAREEKTNDTN